MRCTTAHLNCNDKIRDHGYCSKTFGRNPKPPIGLGASTKPPKLELEHIEEHEGNAYERSTNSALFVDAFGGDSKQYGRKER